MSAPHAIAAAQLADIREIQNAVATRAAAYVARRGGVPGSPAATAIEIVAAQPSNIATRAAAARLCAKRRLAPP